MELNHPEYRRDGFFFDEVSFKLDLYRLITYFYASATLAEVGAHVDTQSWFWQQEHLYLR